MSVMTPELLCGYCEAAFTNANKLVQEASLLYANGHWARAYFLAVAGIEETGKGLIAFDAQGRNLADSAVSSKVKHAMEDHGEKIIAAFAQWLPTNPKKPAEEDVKLLLDLMIHVKRGREPSMYTDINPDGSRIKVPSEMVRDAAARDCVRLARDCLAHARSHVSGNVPRRRTRAEDQLFAMKNTEIQKIINTEDFWWFYIAQLRLGQGDLSDAFIQYRTKYFLRGRQFGRQDNTDE